MLSEAPAATTRSADRSSSAATGLANPPAIPSAYGLPANSPLPSADVASTAPIRSASSSSARRAPARTAPRPATIAGRRAPASRSAAASTASAAGRVRVVGAAAAGTGAGDARSSPGAACTSRGSMSATARRSRAARRKARATSSSAAGGRVHALGHRPDGGGQRRLVDPEVRADRGRRGVAGQHHQGRAGLRGLGQPGQRVGEPRALVDGGHADLAGDPGPGVGHRDRRGLVPGGEEGGAAIDQGPGDDEVPAAHNPEHLAAPQRRDGPAHRLGDRHGGDVRTTPGRIRRPPPRPRGRSSAPRRPGR